MINFPSGNDYYDCIQNPNAIFKDLELKNCKVAKDQSGMPLVYSGGFTSTFNLFNSHKKWAVRCFTKEINDLRRRYQAITNFIEMNKSRYFVKTILVNDGIRVKGYWHPIIKMEWIDGYTLDEYIDKNIFNRSEIIDLANKFMNLVKHLDSLGIAHGDLQHGNIIVQGGSLYLIDYDGMYLPELNGLKTNEIGHQNYQHPSRTIYNYDSKIDRFSSIVIYLSLLILSINPSLWREYCNGENLVFTQEDYFNIQKSKLFEKISSYSEIREYMDRFRNVCNTDYDSIPSLVDFISGNFKVQTSTYQRKQPNISYQSRYIDDIFVTEKTEQEDEIPFCPKCGTLMRAGYSVFRCRCGYEKDVNEKNRYIKYESTDVKKMKILQKLLNHAPVTKYCINCRTKRLHTLSRGVNSKGGANIFYACNICGKSSK